MPLPTKAFGAPGQSSGGGAKRVLRSGGDGLAAMAARLGGAKPMKAMKPPTKKGRQKQDLSTGTGLASGKGM